MPTMKLVGKCYHDEDKVGGTFSAKWGEWFEKDLFSPLVMHDGEGEPFEDCDAYIGLCRCKEGEPYQYWIGVFLPLDFKVPEGYDSVEFEAGDIAVVWVYGKEPDIYAFNSMSALEKEGYKWKSDKNGVFYCFERYTCPRFTSPDKDGNVILDMCYYI